MIVSCRAGTSTRDKVALKKKKKGTLWPGRAHHRIKERRKVRYNGAVLKNRVNPEFLHGVGVGNPSASLNIFSFLCKILTVSYFEQGCRSPWKSRTEISYTFLPFLFCSVPCFTPEFCFTRIFKISMGKKISNKFPNLKHVLFEADFIPVLHQGTRMFSTQPCALMKHLMRLDITSMCPDVTD